MHSRLSGLALALTMSATALTSGCESDPAPAAEPTTSSPSAAAGPAVVMPSSTGVFTSCVIRGKDGGDYLWSGVRFRARADATLENAGPAHITNARVVGRWISTDAGDDGAFLEWSDAGKFLKRLRPLTPAKGAALAAGTTYRLVLRLRPIADAPNAQVTGADVTWSSADGQGDTLTDPTILKIARSNSDC